MMQLSGFSRWQSSWWSWPTSSTRAFLAPNQSTVKPWTLGKLAPTCPSRKTSRSQRQIRLTSELSNRRTLKTPSRLKVSSKLKARVSSKKRTKIWMLINKVAKELSKSDLKLLVHPRAKAFRNIRRCQAARKLAHLPASLFSNRRLQSRCLKAS